MTSIQNNTVVYTVIVDDYDLLLEPKKPNDKIDYICFTDNPSTTSDTWKIKYIQDETLSARELNRKIKLLPHKIDALSKYEYSVYIDGNVHITGDISELVKRFWEFDFACPRHFKRNCVYEEARACLEESRGEPSAIKKQMERYQKEGFPKENGLAAASVLFRRHTEPEVQVLLENWWEEFTNGANRDQLSLPYVMWRHNYKYELVDEGPRLGSDYFQLTRHIPDRRFTPFWRFWVKCQAYRDRAIRYMVGYYIGALIYITLNEGILETLGLIFEKIQYISNKFY